MAESALRPAGRALVHWWTIWHNVKHCAVARVADSPEGSFWLKYVALVLKKSVDNSSAKSASRRHFFVLYCSYYVEFCIFWLIGHSKSAVWTVRFHLGSKPVGLAVTAFFDSLALAQKTDSRIKEKPVGR
ncbi:MAG: hypothetical protein ACOY81_08530 [Bacillota bacterium]